MAVPKNRKTKSPPKKRAPFVFWTLFFIIVISLFFVNLQLIRSGIENTGLLDRLFHRTDAGTAGEGAPDLTEAPAVPEAPDTTGIAGEPAAPELPPEAPLADAPEEPPQVVTLPESTPAAQPVTPPGPVPGRARSLYFIRVDEDGALLRTPVTRNTTASDSPLREVLRLLLQGPSAEENRRNPGLRSLIPQGTRLLRVEVRGSTAYISFSEEFQFNTFGAEGYMGQLWQIIWTVTEFPNITDVQILIEGNRVDFLGERIPIGSPLGRNSRF
ncbi:MAG: GerMN domain-containing protein [Treponema sp.]|nr:GerMN domain-containing protein [Treponema sp.]